MRVVDSVTDTGYYSSLAIDTNKNLILSYFDGKENDLKFAISKDNGSTWNRSTIDKEGIVGHYSSITVDKVNNYVVSYLEGHDAYNLKCATSSDYGNTWNVVTVDTEGDVGFYSTVAVDNNNNYLISYYDSTFQNLLFAKSTDKGKSWSKTTVDSPGNVGQFNSLTVDLENNYIISYRDTTSGTLKAAKSIDGGVTWISKTVDRAKGVGLDSAITSNERGEYLISHYDGINGDLRFSKSVDGGNSWTTSVIYSSGSAGTYTDIASTGDRIAISFHHNENKSLHISQSNDSGISWNTSVVDNAGNAGHYTSLKILPSGAVGISYFEAERGDLKYASVQKDSISPSISITSLTQRLFSIAKPQFTGIAHDDEFAVKEVEYALSPDESNWRQCSLSNQVLNETFDTDVDISKSWIITGEVPWSRSTTTSTSGINSLSSSLTSLKESSSINKTITIESTSFLFFDWKTQGTPLRSIVFCLDNPLCTSNGLYDSSLTGNQDWRTEWVPLAQGTHTLTWNYSSHTNAEEATTTSAWIDSIVTRSSEASFVCSPEDELTDGTYTMYIRSTDSAGNTTYPSNYTLLTFTVDTQPPEISIDQVEDVLVSNNTTALSTHETQPTIKGITGKKSSLTLTIPELKITEKIETNSEGNWNWKPEQHLPHKHFILHVSAQDETGNTSQAQYTLEILGLADTGEVALLPFLIGLFVFTGSWVICRKILL